MSTPTTADDLRQQLEVDYGTYVATRVIYVDGVRAFNVGDPVPASHVERGVVGADEVAKSSTKAGRAAAGTDESKG